LRTGTALGAASVASGVALTATASWLITRASEHPPVLTLLVAIVGVRTFGLARPALRYAERIVSHDAALRLLAERRATVYDALAPLVPGRLGRHRGDVLTSIVDDVDSLVDRQLRVRQPVWTAVLVGVLATGFAALMTPVAGLVVGAMCLLAASAWPVAHLGVRAAEPELVRRRAALSTRVEALVHSARDLVLWRATAPSLAAIDAEAAALGRAAQRSARAMALARALPLLAGGAGLLAMAAWAPSESVSPAMLALLVMLPIALVDAFAPLPDAGALAVRTSAAETRLDELAGQTPLVQDPALPLSVTAPHPAVETRELAVGWGDRPVIKGLTLTLAPGARVGVVGASGSGKSTYAAALLRFLDPQAGVQALDDVDLRALAMDEVRRVTGLVDDDPHVFGSTVAENVRLARPDASDEEVMEAVDAAHLGAWVRSLPAGLHTAIGEGSAHVSGGERARIGIARALLADQPVLVLDEPTAHLDVDTARRVAREVLDQERGRSIVWITHGTVGLDAMDEVVRLGVDEHEGAMLRT
jgi:thiol reductant ABC exporter CydC subunit